MDQAGGMEDMAMEAVGVVVAWCAEVLTWGLRRDWESVDLLCDAQGGEGPLAPLAGTTLGTCNVHIMTIVSINMSRVASHRWQCCLWVIFAVQFDKAHLAWRRQHEPCQRWNTNKSADTWLFYWLFILHRRGSPGRRFHCRHGFVPAFDKMTLNCPTTAKSGGNEAQPEAPCDCSDVKPSSSRPEAETMARDMDQDNDVDWLDVPEEDVRT